MEAIERRKSRSLWWYVRHPLATRWTRVPIIFALVLGATMLLALTLASRLGWVECRNIEEWYDQTCPAVPARLLFIRAVSILGIAAMVVGPLINSLYRVFRYGQAWETTRHETSVSNIPIIAGVAYLSIALIYAWL